MEDSDDEQMHPNWVALATVKFMPKIFIKSTGTENEVAQKDPKPPTVEIDESASLVYNEILQMPSTSSHQKVQEKPKYRKKRVKIVKQKFDKESLFKLALADDAGAIQKHFEKSLDFDVNATDAFGWTALMMAACEGSVSVFQLLLDLGADLSIADKKGNNAESLAKKKGFDQIVDVAEEFQKQYNCIEISDDEDEPPDDGTLFCADCGIEIAKSTSKSHATSTVHLFSCKFKGNTNIKSFGIARSNLGYQMMRRTGWDGNSALGARANGKLYPIRTVLRKTRTGLGIEQSSAKVTHFKAYDSKAVHFRPPPRALTRKEIIENDLSDKRRDQRLRKALS